MGVISNMFRAFQSIKVRTQMTVVNVYGSCNGIKNVCFFPTERTICGPDQSTILTKFDSFLKED